MEILQVDCKRASLSLKIFRSLDHLETSSPAPDPHFLSDEGHNLVLVHNLAIKQPLKMTAWVVSSHFDEFKGPVSDETRSVPFGNPGRWTKSMEPSLY